jgi:hypothetical protein
VVKAGAPSGKADDDGRANAEVTGNSIASLCSASKKYAQNNSSSRNGNDKRRHGRGGGALSGTPMPMPTCTPIPTQARRSFADGTLQARNYLTRDVDITSIRRRTESRHEFHYDKQTLRFWRRQERTITSTRRRRATAAGSLPWVKPTIVS